MPTHLLTSGMLMDFSASRMDTLRWSGDEDQRRVVTRLMDEPSAYRRWGAFHYSLMQKVAATHSREEQLLCLRHTTLMLLHRQAPFAYLRQNKVTGRDRHAVFAAIYGFSADYVRAVITEHGRYVQSNSSLYCAGDVDLRVMQDTRFADALPAYGEQYMEYFSAYCDWAVAESRGIDSATRFMVPEMKQRMSQSAAKLLSLPATLPERRRRQRAWGAVSGRSIDLEEWAAAG